MEDAYSEMWVPTSFSLRFDMDGRCCINNRQRRGNSAPPATASARRTLVQYTVLLRGFKITGEMISTPINGRPILQP